MPGSGERRTSRPGGVTTNRRGGRVPRPPAAESASLTIAPPRVRIARSATELRAARALVREYAATLEIDLGFQGFDEEIATFPGTYAPPGGIVLLAYSGRSVAGIVALRRWRGAVCKMKRLYVRPEFRGRGVGEALAGAVLRTATRAGYRTMRLDTLPSMVDAIRLYRRLGFREIPPYRYNPVRGARSFELPLPGRAWAHRRSAALM